MGKKAIQFWQIYNNDGFITPFLFIASELIIYFQTYDSKQDI